MNLTWQNVDAAIKRVLLDDQTDAAALEALNDLIRSGASKEELIEAGTAHGVTVVQGCIHTMAFNTERLNAERDNIAAMLRDVDDAFIEGKGGGMTLMNLVATKDGTLWGEQWQADMLYCMAAGLGLAWHTLPRNMWPQLPGGMPYVTVRAQ